MIPHYLQTRFPALLACEPPKMGVLIVSKHLYLFINNICALYRNVLTCDHVAVHIHLRCLTAVLLISFMFLSP